MKKFFKILLRCFLLAVAAVVFVSGIVLICAWRRSQNDYWTDSRLSENVSVRWYYKKQEYRIYNYSEKKIVAKSLDRVVKPAEDDSLTVFFRQGLRGYLNANTGRADYVEGKQTLIQLSAKYNVSERTIRRDLEGMRFVHSIAKYKEVTIQLDTTYWGRDFGLMVIKDILRNKVLWHKYVHNETIAQYVEGVSWLKSKGFKIHGAVIDGMRGLAQALYPIPVQMCQFHQILITRRYLTQDPDLEASIELLDLVKSITRMDKESFVGAFNEWYEK